MVDCNCAFYGCSTSRTHEFAILKSLLLAQMMLNKNNNNNNNNNNGLFEAYLQSSSTSSMQ